MPRSKASLARLLVNKELLYTRDERGRIPLHLIAQYHNDHTIVHWLISNFASPEQQQPLMSEIADNNGLLPIHYALQSRQHAEFVRELLPTKRLRLIDYAIVQKVPLVLLESLPYREDLEIPDPRTGRLPIHLEVERKPRWRVLEWLAKCYPESIAIVDPKTKLSPVLTAATQGLSLNHTYVMLREYPDILLYLH